MRATVTTSVQDSIDRALHAGRILVTDLENSPDVLVEVLAEEGEDLVIGQFIVRPREPRKAQLRYREPSTRWPEI